MKRTKRNLLFKRKMTILTAAVFLGLCGSVVPGTAEAAKLIVSGGGRSVFDVDFVKVTDQNKEAAGVLVLDFLKDKSETVIPYNHPEQTQKGVINGVQYWADMLGSGTKNPVPAQIFVRGGPNTAMRPQLPLLLRAENRSLTCIGYSPCNKGKN